MFCSRHYTIFCCTTDSKPTLGKTDVRLTGDWRKGWQWEARTKGTGQRTLTAHTCILAMQCSAYRSTCICIVWC